MSFLARWFARRPVGAAYCVVLVVAISYRVLPTAGILAYGDYPYFWPGRAFDPMSTMQASFFGLPRPTAMFVTWLAFIPSMLSRLLPHELVAYLLIFGVLALAAFAWLDVTRRITGRTELGYVAATMLVLSTVTMEHLVIQASHIFATMLTLALTARVALEIHRTRACTTAAAVQLALITLLVTHPLFWAIHVALTAALLAVAICRWHVRSICAAILTFALISLLHAFWLVPFVATTITSTNDAIFNGTQDTIFEELRHTTTFVSASTFLQMGGDWQSVVYGGRLPYALTFGAPALGAVVLASTARSARGRGALAVSIVVYAACVLLTLGPNAPLLGPAWSAAYAHVPGFGLLRHFTRLATYAQLASIVVVVAALLVLAEQRSRAYRPAVALVLIVVFATQWPLLTGNAHGAMGAARIPRAYEELNARFLESPEDFTVVTYPATGYEAYTWSINPRTDVFRQFMYFEELAFAQPVAFNRYVAPELSTSIPWGAQAFAYNPTFAPYPDFDDDLAKTDVRYVLIHRDAYDLGTGAPVTDVHRYTDYFERDPAYRLVADNEVYALYERLSYLPRIRGEHVTFQRLNDATYRVTLHGLTGPRTVRFLQHFNTDWAWYPDSPHSCEVVRRFADDLIECRSNVHHGVLDALRSAQLPLAVPHTLADGYANAWVFDSDSLRTQFAPSEYIEHFDGSIDVTIVLQYRPQQWFYAGLIVSVATASTLLALGLASIIRARVRAT